MKKNFLDKLNRLDRVKVFKAIMALLLALLLIQLFRLTIVQGSYYRDLSDNRRVKEVQITAQRGEIRDRNGVLLAGNRPVFTLQLRKDELDRLDQEEKNSYFISLIRYLEEDRVDVLDSFPIVLNSFAFERGTRTSQEAQDRVVKALADQEDLGGFLDSTWDKPYQDHFDYSLMEEVLLALRMDPDKGPIVLRRGQPAYISDQARESFKAQEDLDQEASARQDIVTLLRGQETAIQEVLTHPIARSLAYDFLSERGAISGIVIRPYADAHYDSYINRKSQLAQVYEDISLKSSAKEDFFTILRENSLESLLKKPVENPRETYPALDLVDLANKSLGDEVFEASLTSKLPQVNLTSGGDGFDSLLALAMEDDDLLEAFLEEGDNKSLAQAQLIEDGISSGISVAGEGYTYTDLKSSRDLYDRYDQDPKDGVQALFEAMVQAAKLDEDLSVYEKKDILNAYREVAKQGNYAYIPVNFAYEISDKAVARIEENIPLNVGIEISVEPIRHYPLGQSTAHVLGYIGSIAQDREIDKYVDGLGYSRNALIGKTGIEEAYEEALHGDNGSRLVSVDSIGNTTEVLEEQAPTMGANVNLSIDINLQVKAEEALAQGLADIREGGTYTSDYGTYTYQASQEKGRTYVNAKSGALVVLDVKTGDVLALANYPAYDPNLFSTGISATDWASLQPEEEKDLLAPRPLYNTAYQSAIQPGSSFKMVTGLAALENGLNPRESVKCGGYVEFGNHRFGCWLWNQSGHTHGDESLAEAIRDSCNYYFYSLALGRDQRKDIPISGKVSAEDISAMAKRFGLGESVGLEINIPNEAKGIRPDPESKATTLKALLRIHLDEHIDTYAGKTLPEKKREDLIDEIVACLDRDQTMSREETWIFLDGLGLDPDKRVAGFREGLVDILKYTYIDEAQWKISDTMNITIGQGENAYTPLQMARFTMGLANEGDLHELSLVDSVTDGETGRILEKEDKKTQEVGLSSDDYYSYVKEGMKLASTDGLNTPLFSDFPIDVGLKTGTAERSGVNPYTQDTYDAFAWEVAFAPYDKPEIAVVCMLPQGGSGGNASPMIHAVMCEYFGLNKEVREDTLPIETELAP